MTENFSAAAQRLAGAASRLLGWRPAEFWTATPAELATALAPPGEKPMLNREDVMRMMERDDGHGPD